MTPRPAAGTCCPGCTGFGRRSRLPAAPGSGVGVWSRPGTSGDSARGMLPKAAPRATSTRCSWNWRPPWGDAPLEAEGLLAWLEQGAKHLPLPGPGVQDAGLQVLGLLEMRGLEFSRVFCLGMNSGALPPPPRSLPPLSAAERRLVLGGTYRSQHEFSRELYDTLLGAAPELILSRPQVADDEERVGSPLYLGPWEPQEMAVLSRPHRAWLRSPAIRAAFSDVGAAFGGYGDGPLSVLLAPEYSLSQAATALGCPCRFLLEFLLKLKELPEIEAGLDPRERGDRLHKVLGNSPLNSTNSSQSMAGTTAGPRRFWRPPPARCWAICWRICTGAPNWSAGSAGRPPGPACCGHGWPWNSSAMPRAGAGSSWRRSSPGSRGKAGLSP